MECWKQPTPTDIRDNENVDLLSRLLFFDILNGCQNKDYHKVYYHGNKRIDLDLKRGQYLFVVSRYERDLEISRRKIEKSLQILSKWYTELQIERKPFGLVITVKDYDTITTLRNEVHNERKTNVKRMQNERKSNNKSVKSVKSDIDQMRDLRNDDFITRLKGDDFAVIRRYTLKDDYIESVISRLEDYCLSTGKRYKDYQATLRNWIKSDIEKNPERFSLKFKYKVQNGIRG